MGNKPKWNEALSNAMRGQIGTTREVFTNANGSNVMLEKTGDKWHKDNSFGSNPGDDEEDEEEPEDEEDDEEDDNNPGGGGPSNPNQTPVKPNNEKQVEKKKKPICVVEEKRSPEPETSRNQDNDKTNEQKFGPEQPFKKSREYKVYEQMRDEINKQFEYFYKTGKFSIDPTKMMNEVFHNIMGKNGYKSVFNNWFKNVAEKHTWIKKAWEKYQAIAPTKFAKTLKKKLTLQNIGKLLKLKPSVMTKLNKAFNLLKIFKGIASNPVGFIINAFTKGAGMSAEMGDLITAVGSGSAGDILSYIITLIIA